MTYSKLIKQMMAAMSPMESSRDDTAIQRAIVAGRAYLAAPEPHVGDSRFESWFSEYSGAGKGTKQQMRDAYAAGMGDDLAAPEQSEPVAYLEYARKKPDLRRLVFTQTSKKDLDVNGWVSEPLFNTAPPPTTPEQEPVGMLRMGSFAEQGFHTTKAASYIADSEWHPVFLHPAPEPVTKPLPGADWTITMRRMMNSGCSKRKCTCKPENAENCIWWDEPGDAPQPTELSDEFESLLARAEAEPHASPNLVNACRTARAVLAAQGAKK